MDIHIRIFIATLFVIAPSPTQPKCLSIGKYIVENIQETLMPPLDWMKLAIRAVKENFQDAILREKTKNKKQPPKKPKRKKFLTQESLKTNKLWGKKSQNKTGFQTLLRRMSSRTHSALVEAFSQEQHECADFHGSFSMSPRLLNSTPLTHWITDSLSNACQHILKGKWEEEVGTAYSVP